MEERKPFQGVLNILSFNRHFYVFGFFALSLLFLSRMWISWPIWMFWLVIIGFMYGLLMPLLVSAYVYDLSGYYNLHWLDRVVSDKRKIKEIVNINAGFDETSFIIKGKFQHANLQVFDFFDKDKHTEPAIKRARKVSLVYPNTRTITSDAIPLDDNSVDLICLLSAVHEMRDDDEKVVFLQECSRIMKPSGNIIMVEHLRDFPNFAAFTIGFTHFFSKATWEKAFAGAGYPLIKEIKFTPFMSIFSLPQRHSS